MDGNNLVHFGHVDTNASALPLKPEKDHHQLSENAAKGRVTSTHTREVAFQASTASIRYDGHAILACNIDDFYYIFCRIRVHHDAMREPCPQSEPVSSK